MKLNFILPLFILFSLTNCKLIKAIKQQEIKNTPGKYFYNNKKDFIYFETLLENNKVNFMFDTGASMSLITDSTCISDFTKKVYKGIGSIKGADRKKINRKILVTPIETTLFSSRNKVFSYVNMNSTNKCTKKNEFQGILGVDVIFQDNLLLLMDFTNSSIEYITYLDINKLLTKDGYQKIKSECKMNQIFIFLNIDKKEYRFKLDTGFLGNIVIPYNDKLNFEKHKNVVIEGEYFQTVSGRTNGEETFYENLEVNFGDLNVHSNVLVSKTIKAQNIGINFIKGFDWIIDFYNNEVYIKKNKTEIISALEKRIFQYKISEINNKLIIIAKQKNQSKYAIGDQITSINKVKVTSENVCEMQELLNNTEDWNSLTLEIIPKTK